MKRAMMFGLALSLSTSALAQQDEPAPQPEGVYKPVTVVEFGTELEIDGELVRPEIRLFSDVRRGQFAPMIQLRADFNDEMSDSADDVK